MVLWNYKYGTVIYDQLEHCAASTQLRRRSRNIRGVWLINNENLASCRYHHFRACFSSFWIIPSWRPLSDASFCSWKSNWTRSVSDNGQYIEDKCLAGYWKIAYWVISYEFRMRKNITGTQNGYKHGETVRSLCVVLELITYSWGRGTGTEANGPLWKKP